MARKKKEAEVQVVKADINPILKVTLAGEVRHEMWLEFYKIINAKMHKYKELQVNIDSGGGDLVAGQAITSFIGELRAQGIPVTTVALSTICSVALPMFMAGDRRHALETTLFMQHLPMLTSISYPNPVELARYAAILEKDSEWCLTASTRDTKINSKELRELINGCKDQDYFFSTAWAKEKGLVNQNGLPLPSVGKHYCISVSEDCEE